MYKKIVSSSLLAVTLLVMNGCGGGSSSSDTPISTVSKISGVAVDDLILNGAVTATDTANASLATGRTSSTDGTYTLNVAYSGIVLLNVSCDDDSMMWNTATPISEAETCGSDITLNSLAAVEAGVDQTVNITPLTEIVYQRATALAEDGNIANIDVNDVNEARTEIGLMFSLDPLSEDPTDGDYAEIISSIHAIATANDSTVVEITAELADALSDGSADGEDIIMELVAEMDEANLINNLVENNGTYTPPEDAAPLSDIDAAKALFTELRTQAMSVTDYTNSGTPGFLDTEALSMEEALNGVVLDISFMEMALNNQIDTEKYMRTNNLTEYTKPIGSTRTLTLTLTGPSSYNYMIVQSDGVQSAATWSGTVSYPVIDETNTYTFTTLTAQIDGTFPLGYEYESVPAGVENSQSFNGSIVATKTSTGANFELNGEVASNTTSLAITDATAELAYEEDTTTGEPILNYFKFNGVTLQGVVGGYTIDGSIAVNSYVQNAGLAELGGIDEEYSSYVSVQFICPTSTLTISDVSFTYDTVTYMPTYSDIYQTDAWFSFGEISGNVQYDEVLPNLSYSATCSGGEILEVYPSTWVDSNTKIANSGWLPNDVTFTGAISRTGASIEGTLNAKWLNAATMDIENGTEIPLVDVILNGKLQMPERPEMLMSITFENNATHNTLGASYTYDTTVVNAEGIFDAEMLNGDIAVTTHTGIRADVKVSEKEIVYGGTSTVTKDGLLIGEFEDREGIPVVKYTDGSFESIF